MTSESTSLSVQKPEEDLGLDLAPVRSQNASLLREDWKQVIRLNPKHYSTLSFADEPVLVMFCDYEAKRLVVGIAGASSEEGLVLEGVRLEISGWSEFICKQHIGGGVLERLAEFPGELSDICEFEIRNECIWLAGFGRQSGSWLELTLTDAKLAVEYANQRRA